jgi:hypothetical protein
MAPPAFPSLAISCGPPRMTRRRRGSLQAAATRRPPFQLSRRPAISGVRRIPRPAEPGHAFEQGPSGPGTKSREAPARRDWPGPVGTRDAERRGARSERLPGPAGTLDAEKRGVAREQGREVAENSRRGCRVLAEWRRASPRARTEKAMRCSEICYCRGQCREQITEWDRSVSQVCR